MSVCLSVCLVRHTSPGNTRPIILSVNFFSCFLSCCSPNIRPLAPINDRLTGTVRRLAAACLDLFSCFLSCCSHNERPLVPINARCTGTALLLAAACFDYGRSCAVCLSFKTHWLLVHNTTMVQAACCMTLSLRRCSIFYLLDYFT